VAETWFLGVRNLVAFLFPFLFLFFLVVINSTWIYVEADFEKLVQFIFFPSFPSPPRFQHSACALPDSVPLLQHSSFLPPFAILTKRRRSVRQEKKSSLSSFPSFSERNGDSGAVDLKVQFDRLPFLFLFPPRKKL